MRLLFLIVVVAWQATCSKATIPLNRVIGSVNTFSNNVVKVIVEGAPGNVVCSPTSVDMVLSMATFGARGNTDRVLRSALALNDDDSVTLNGYQSLVDTLTNAKGFKLRMANKIFLGIGFRPSADFREATTTGFRSRAMNVNFGNPPEASKIINDWAEAQTNSRIKDLVKADDFTSDTALVLVNAVYFKADWDDQFDEYDTKPRRFHVHGKSVKNVTTMWGSAERKHGELPDVKATFVEIPYESDSSIDDVSMFIILPDEIDGIADLVKNLEKVTVQRLLRGEKRVITLQLPKFRIESTIDLEIPLTKLGVGEIFTDNADFSGIVKSSALKVNKIVQKAFIEVNEKGTEAAAATKFDIGFRMQSYDIELAPLDFHVDHPFVAVIATKRGLPLFSSVIMEPIY